MIKLSKVSRLKRENKAAVLDIKLMEAWNKGFYAGSKQQKETDIEQVIKWLANLKEIPGIGEKRAFEIQRHFLDFFRGSE